MSPGGVNSGSEAWHRESELNGLWERIQQDSSPCRNCDIPE